MSEEDDSYRVLRAEKGSTLSHAIARIIKLYVFHEF